MSANEIIQQAASSPRVAVAVPTVTTAIGFADIQNWLTTTSMILGIIISIVLLGNHLIKRRILIKQEKMLDESDSSSKDIDTDT